MRTAASIRDIPDPPPWTWSSWVVVGVVAVTAASVRLTVLLRNGILSFGHYDDGVHFAVALNLVHGRLPYRDVLFLQPPGLPLAAAPFAALAGFVGDAGAFALARIAFTLLGTLNAVLIVLILRRFGRVAALSGGLLYALSWPAAYAERSVLLEVLGSTGVLLALLLLPLGRARGRRWALYAGLAAGAAIGFKIWYVLPFLVLAIWSGRRVGIFLLGGVVAGLVVYLPFFVAAPAAMWQQIVLAQLGRHRSESVLLGTRTRLILGVDAPQGWLTVVLLVVLVLLLVPALIDRRSRVFVALLATSAALLLVTPSFFQHYVTLTAGPLALVGGVGAGRVAALRRGGRRGLAVPVVAVVALLALGVNLGQDIQLHERRAPIRALREAAAAVPGCLLADDPTILILMNRLSTDLRRGCDVRADPSGLGYVVKPAGVTATPWRRDNPAFQSAILRYLRSGNGYLIVRAGNGLGLSPASLRIVDADAVLWRHGRFVIRTASPPVQPQRGRSAAST